MGVLFVAVLTAVPGVGAYFDLRAWHEPQQITQDPFEDVFATKAGALDQARKLTHGSNKVPTAVERPWRSGDELDCWALCPGAATGMARVEPSESGRVTRVLRDAYGLVPAKGNHVAYNDPAHIRGMASYTHNGQLYTCSVQVGDYKTNAANEVTSERITNVGCLDAHDAHTALLPVKATT